MHRKRLVVVVFIILITNISTLFITKHKVSSTIATEKEQEIESVTSYSDFERYISILTSNLKKDYSNLQEQETTISIYPGDQNINKLWVNGVFDVINNDMAYPKKKGLYIINSKKDIVTKVNFSYQPEIKDKLYLSVNRILNNQKSIKEWKESSCIVFSNSITTKGMFIQIITTSTKDATYNDEFINMLANENTEITSKIQDIIIKNNF